MLRLNCEKQSNKKGNTMDYNYNDTTKNRKNKHLDLSERITIELRLKDGWSAYKIANGLGMSLNTIRNEITSGTVK